MSDWEMPSNVEYEKAALGYMMLSPAMCDVVAGTLNAEDFYEPKHGLVFAAAVALRLSGEPASMMAVAERMLAEGTLNRVGGAAYLHTCMAAAMPSAGTVGFFTSRLLELSKLRTVRTVGIRLAELGKGSPVHTADEILHRAMEELTGAQHHDVGSDVIDASEGVMRVQERFDAQRSSDGPVRGLPYGIGQLDALTGGLHPGHLVVPAGRPGMGKSLWSMDIARQLATRDGVPVVIFSAEMPCVDVFERFHAAQSGVRLDQIRANRFVTPAQAERYEEAVKTLNQAPIWVVDKAPMQLDYLAAQLRTLHRKHRVGLAVVDYVQKIRVPGLGRTSTARYQEIGEVASTLKGLTKELGIPIIAPAQVGRSAEQRTDKRPQLSDLRESGDIENEADLVIGLYREDEYRDSNDPDDPPDHKVELGVIKNRHGRNNVSIYANAEMDLFRFTEMGAQPERKEAW